MRKYPKEYPRLVAGLLGVVATVNNEEEERQFYRNEWIAFGIACLQVAGVVAFVLIVSWRA